MEEIDKPSFDFAQSCVIPYRLNNGEIELLLITSIKKRKWIFPKGFIEFNLSPFESAKKEAYEEAGVIGENETIELGAFELKKKNGISLIKVFSMEVTKELKDYPEKNLRKRKWFGLIYKPGGLRIYGAGIASSLGEVQHALSKNVDVRRFDPDKIVLQKYDVWHLQPILYAIDSFEQLENGFKDWTKKAGLL